MNKEKLTNQLKNAYKQLEEEFKNKGRPNTIEDNNVDYDNNNIYAMRQKISDLEAKLAESEECLKLYKQSNKVLNDQLDKATEHISELNEQLAEKDEDLKATTESLYASREYLDKLKSEKWALEQQLADKDNEIETMKQALVDREETIVFADKTIKGLNLNHNQDKISFAVEKLSDVRSFISDATEIKEPYYTKVCNYIEKQIEELKKDMKQDGKATN